MGDPTRLTQVGRHRSDEVSETETQIQINPAGRFLILENADWERFSAFLVMQPYFIQIHELYGSIVKCCTLWSFLAAEWQLTEDKQPLNLVFHWIKSVFCFSCPALLLSRFELPSSLCWRCCISIKVERRQAIKFWMLMWWSSRSGPHTHRQKETHTHLRELQRLGCLSSDVLLCN